MISSANARHPEGTPTATTDRPDLEAALARDSLLLANVRDSVIVTDLDGVVTYWNEGATRLFGWTADEMLGRPYAERFPTPEARDFIAEQIRTRGRDGGWSMEWEDYRKDGSRVWIDARIVPVEDEGGRAVGLLGLAHDISARKRAEEALERVTAESERRRLYEAVLSSIPDFVYVFSLDHRVLYANDALIKMWGHRPEDTIGKTFLEIGYAPWHAAMHDREIDRVRATKKPLRGEVPFTGTSGRRIYDYIFVPVFGADGEVEAVAGTTRDVTDRKRSEDELRASEERLAQVFNLAPSFMCVVRGPSHVFERANDQYLRLVGKRDILGKPVIEALPEVADQGFIELLDGVYRTGEPYVGSGVAVHLQRSPDRPPEERFVDFVYQPLKDHDGSVSGILAQGIDLTERVLAEEALRASEEEFRTTFEGAGVGKAQASLDGRLVRVNPRLCELLGYPSDELVGMSIKEITHPDDRDQDFEHFRRLAAGEPPHYAIEKRYVRKTGEVVWVRVTATLIRDRDGRPLRGSAVIEDITSRKEAEAALAEASRRKDEFLATLAHELRNPLAPIRSGLEILSHGASGDAGARVREMMHRQLAHMVRLIDDLLDVSRITTGKVTLRRERVVLQSAAEVAVEAARPALDAARHALAVDLAGEPLWVDVDATRVAQVVTNLLTNAAKYTPDGGRVTLAVKHDGDAAVLQVTDTGLGIPKDMLAEVFEMFAQVNRTLDRSQGGLGIGLALTKRLVEMHGGTIAAESEGPGRGSTFTVRLPLAASGPRRGPGRPGGQPASGTSAALRILVVDDNADAAESLAMLLDLSGHTTRTAHAGTEALHAARDFAPELVFLDLGLPGMDGYEVARRLREDPQTSAAVVVALTGWGSPDDRQKSHEAGFDFHLTKPADASAVEDLIARVAARRTARPQLRDTRDEPW